MKSNRDASVLRVIDGRPVVLHDGKPIPKAGYCDYIPRGEGGWTARNQQFLKDGVKVYHLRVAYGIQQRGKDFFDQPYWENDGLFHPNDDGYFHGLDSQAETILAEEPDALFFIKFLTATPFAYNESNPGHVQTDEDGRQYCQASLSSEKTRKQISRLVATMIKHAESRPWASRIVGYLGMPEGEGIMPLNITGKMFDCSEVNEAGFKKWVKAKYKTVAKLRKAWFDASLSFAKVRVPRDKDVLAKMATMEPTHKGKTIDRSKIALNCKEEGHGLQHWVEECNVPAERDYARYMREQWHDWTLSIYSAAKRVFKELGVKRFFALDTAKQPQVGWQIMSSFDGIGDGQSFPPMFLFTGSWGVRDLYNHKDFDGIWNPTDYYARSLGFALESEGATDSLCVRGKISMVEDDSRTYVGDSRHDLGAFRNMAEVDAGLKRNVAYAHSRGLARYWCNVGSSFYFDDDVHKPIAQTTRMLDRFGNGPHRETEDAIAFVIDDTSMLYENFTSGYQSLATIVQRIHGLAHCGVPYRIYLLSDLELDNFPRYKTWFFPNLFKLDKKVLDLLHKKVLRDGNVAILGPSTGITNGKHIGPERISKLLNVDMEMHYYSPVRNIIIQNHDHPITRNLPAGFSFGDSMPYGPIIAPSMAHFEKHPKTVLGHGNANYYLNRSGLLVKEFGKGAEKSGKRGKRGKGDYALLWTMAMPLPAELIRECARYAGSNIWSEEGDVIYASDSFVSITSMKSGMRTVRLPRACKVTDALTGKPYGKGKVKKIDVRIKAPQTRMFILE
jgi:hypothetical protein